jgi:hypothetical protein
MKRIIHRNHRPRLKELGKRCRQHYRIKKSCNKLSKKSLKKKNKVEEGGALGSGVEREHEST